MGVPALYRQLSKKYPRIVVEVQEDKEVPDAPADMSGPNPNGMEFDNLYLDMNGIVHPCTHPEGKPAPKTEGEMMIEVFKYTERVVAMVKPRKLLFMAIDGVAPRAKMNQQRSRRFRSAREAQEVERDRLAAVEEWRKRGSNPDAISGQEEKAWDSNAITPGTPFMHFLAASLRYWTARKMNTDRGWANIEVIISDASVPGEGEHKIMDFVRRQRTQPGYDPNTQHVIYGLDADLIMLALATHEPHFRVLREDVFAAERNKPRSGCHTCGQPGHHSSNCTGVAKARPANGVDDGRQAPPDRKPFIFLDVSVLREYLEAELTTIALPFPSDLERAIDDWVCILYFVGNDFLPHLPSLEIREGAIDTLLKIWRDSLPSMGGYLTEHGELHLDRLQVIMQGLASREDDIFRKRREAEEKQIERSGGKRPRMDDSRPSTPMGSRAAQNYVNVHGDARAANMSAADRLRRELLGGGDSGASTPISRPGTPMSEVSEIGPPSSPVAAVAPPPFEPPPSEGGIPGFGGWSAPPSAPPVAAPVEEPPSVTEPPVNSAPPSAFEASTAAIETSPVASKKRSADEAGLPDGPADESYVEQVDLSVDQDDAEDPDDSQIVLPGMPKVAPLKRLGNNQVEQEDSVKLWEPGYKERYYRQKFGVEPNDAEFRRKLVTSYVEGLAWVLRYYYQGCASWQWSYMYHYAPFASDFEDLASIDVSFQLGKPFRPFEQLMGVFPAASRQHIPAPFGNLMIEEDSPILDFYPSEFAVDMNGKKMLWQGVALLPFIDQDRLLAALADRYPQLSEEEVARNESGHDVIFVGDVHPLYDQVRELAVKGKIDAPAVLDPRTSRGLFGSLAPDPDCVPESTFFSPLEGLDEPDVTNDRSVSARYTFPQQLVPHRSVLLPGVKTDRRVLNQSDREQVKRGGGTPGGRGGFHQTRHGIDGGGLSRGDGTGRGGGPYTGPIPQRVSSLGGSPYGGYDPPRTGSPYAGANGSPHRMWTPPPPQPGPSVNSFGIATMPPPGQRAYGMPAPPGSFGTAPNQPLRGYGPAVPVNPYAPAPAAPAPFDNRDALMRSLPQHLRMQQPAPPAPKPGPPAYRR